MDEKMTNPSLLTKKKPICDEKSPLLPVEHHDKDESAEFGGASFVGSVFNLSSSIIGAGIMSLPAAVKALGLGIGVAVMIFMAFLVEASLSMLLRFTKAGKSISYGGVMYDSFGNCGRNLIQICISVNNIGLLIIYMIIIGDVLSGTCSGGDHHAGILEEVFGAGWFTGRTFVLLITTVFVFVPLSLFKRIESLRFTSALSVLLAVVFLLITIGITFLKVIGGTVSVPRMLPIITDLPSFMRLFTVFPVIVTAYLCHFNLHTINNELHDSVSITAVVRTSLVFCLIVYVMTSFFGFLLFGEETLDDVLANFSPTALNIPHAFILSGIVRISYAGHLMLVFPVVFFPLRLNLDGLLFSCTRPLEADATRFASITVALIVLTFLGANFIPSIWDVFQFIGATSAASLCFIFPAAITLKNAVGIATNKEKLLSVVMIVLAVFSNALAIYNDVYSLLKKTVPLHG